MTHSQPLRVYADRTLLPQDVPHNPLLYAFWGAPASDPRSPTAGRFTRYVEQAPELIRLVEPDEAELCVLPPAWEHVEGRSDAEAGARAHAELARSLGVPLVVFYISDSEAEVPLDGAWVYRTSLRRSRLRRRELAMPALTMDVARQELGGSIEVRPWSAEPVVGFCGYAPGAAQIRSLRSLAQALKRRARVVGGNLPDGVFARTRALGSVDRSPRVRSNAVVRDAFWAGAVVPGQEPDYARMTTARREFIENLRESDYVLCARGGGNFSYRLYETLSAGRIPLFVDTDCVLPFEDEIDWRSICVWVDAADVHHSADAVADFHASLGEEGFERLQHECRRVWVEYLSPEGFFGRFGRQPLAEHR